MNKESWVYMTLYTDLRQVAAMYIAKEWIRGFSIVLPKTSIRDISARSFFDIVEIDRLRFSEQKADELNFKDMQSDVPPTQIFAASDVKSYLPQALLAQPS